MPCRTSPIGPSRTVIAACVACVCAAASWASAQFRVPASLPPEQAVRFERFKSFRINGVCGDRDIERLASFGVNTIRGYTISKPEEMLSRLDRYEELGLKMVISEWMPHHGENKDHRGWTWDFDYEEAGDGLVERFTAKVEAIGDHPAILMWGLGNEVHLDEPYLRTVNRMSEAVHERFPAHLTSLTMINAKPEAIEKIKAFAPDLDVIGVQSYSPGAVRNSIRNMEEHWRKPFYVSEFNTKGPWNFGKTEWGEAFDEPEDAKLEDLADCYRAIDASPLCLGSTIFVWGYFRNNRPTYFSLLLDEHPDGPAAKDGKSDLLMTPRAEWMVEHFTQQPFRGNRAPVLTKLETADGQRWASAEPGDRIRVRLAATDPDGDGVRYACWVLDSKPGRPKAVSGPFEFDAVETVDLPAPAKPGEYLVMAYALDGRGGGSASTLPLLVKRRGVEE